MKLLLVGGPPSTGKTTIIQRVIEKRKDTYYPEPKISEEAQHEIKKIIWNERQKKATSAKADKKA